MKIDLTKLAAATNAAAQKSASNSNRTATIKRDVRDVRDAKTNIAIVALEATDTLLVPQTPQTPQTPTVVTPHEPQLLKPKPITKPVTKPVTNLSALAALMGNKPKPATPVTPKHNYLGNSAELIIVDELPTTVPKALYDTPQKPATNVIHSPLPPAVVVAGDASISTTDTPSGPVVGAVAAPSEYLGERAATTQLTLSDLDPSQLAAIELLITYSRAVLVGSAGTGKSTTVHFFIERIMDTISEVTAGMVRKYNADTPATTTMAKIPSISFCAYTGIATQRLASKLDEKLQRNCMTIHRLLGYYPEIVEYYCNETFEIKSKQVFVPHYTKTNPLQWDVIIIDEAGMVPADLWNEFCRALLPTTRVYLVGDIAQLPPIMGTSPLTIAMRDLPTAELTKVHRTENDWITQSAQRIRNGLHPDFNTPVTKFQSLDAYPDRAAQQIVAGVIGLFKQGKFDPTTDAIITATNVNDLGQENLNRKLCKYFNPDNPQIKINAVLSRPRYAIGDKIMVTKNDDEAGLANGMMGYVTDIAPNPKYKGGVSIDFAKLDTILNESDDAVAALAAQEKAESQSLQASHILTASFPDCYHPTSDGECKFSTGNSFSNIQHAYAITCHKAQGGEFRQVILIAHSAAGRMLNREWFYTGWTRAKRNIMVLGNMGGLNKCINNQQLKGKTAADKVAFATKKLDHKLRQAEKAQDPAAKRKVMNSIPQILKTERL